MISKGRFGFDLNQIERAQRPAAFDGDIFYFFARISVYVREMGNVCNLADVALVSGLKRP